MQRPFFVCMVSEEPAAFRLDEELGFLELQTLGFKVKGFEGFSMWGVTRWVRWAPLHKSIYIYTRLLWGACEYVCHNINTRLGFSSVFEF